MRPITKAARPKFTLTKLQQAVAQSGGGAIYDPSSLWGAVDHLPRRNLLTYTEDFSNAIWLKTSTTATANAVTNAAATAHHYINQVATTTALTPYRVSFVVRKGTVRYIAIGYRASAAVSCGAGFDLDNPTTGTAGAAGTDYSASNPLIESLGDNKYRLSVTCIAPTTATNVTLIHRNSAYTSGAISESYAGTTGDTTEVFQASFMPLSTLDQSYQKIAGADFTTEQYANAAAKNVPWLRRNRFLNTATLSTQTVSSVTATPLTVSFTGTGTITFSTAYVGALVGTGAGDRVTATFTPAAGNLVCTVTGTVTLAQCEVAGAATAYQEVGASWDAQFATNAAAAGVALTLFQDSAGTTAVSGPDQPIGKQNDLSGGGYHAVQSGATGLKPVLRLSANGGWYLQRDLSDDNLVVTFPNLGSNCVTYINDGATVTETGSVTLNGATNLNTPAADYGRVYLASPSSKSAQIIKWLKAKAGIL